MKKIIIFGCGYHGRAVFRVLKRRKKKILCWIDNDKKKNNKRLFGKSIKQPIYLKKINYDNIIFCGRDLKAQVMQYKKMNLSLKKIRLWSSFDCAPSKNQKTKREKNAEKILKKILKILYKNNIKFWADYSGLLQLIRDKKLSLLSDFELCFSQRDFKKVETLFSTNYLYNVIKKKLRKKYIKLTIIGRNNKLDFEPPIFDFHFKKIKKNFAEDTDGITKRVPIRFLKKIEEFKFKRNLSIKIPSKYTQYLSYLYGKKAMYKREPFFVNKNHMKIT